MNIELSSAAAFISAEEALRLLGRRDGEQLLGLVDREQEIRLARARGGLERLGQLGERACRDRRRRSGRANSRHSSALPNASAAARANSPTGSSRGRKGGSTIQFRRSRFKRGRTPARTSDDLPEPGGAEQRHQLRRALDAARVEPFDQPAHVVVAAEIDRGILDLEGEEARIGRPPLVPGEAALRVERDLGQLAGELGEAALAVAAEIELLDVGGDEALAARRDDHREDRLAQRPRLGELGEAPLRSRASAASAPGSPRGRCRSAGRGCAPSWCRAGCRHACRCRGRSGRSRSTGARP